MAGDSVTFLREYCAWSLLLHCKILCCSSCNTVCVDVWCVVAAMHFLLGHGVMYFVVGYVLLDMCCVSESVVIGVMCCV